MVELQIQQNEAKRSHFLIHEDNNSDLMASFTEVKVSKLGIDVVASP